MNGILYKNISNNNEVEKNLELATPVTLKYKGDTEKVNPVILLSPSIGVNEYNYIEVDGRYYYINDVIYSQQHTEIKCHVDVLMTYKNDILKQACIIKRQEDENDEIYDHYLNDERYVLRNIERIQLKLLGGSFRENGEKTASYILVLNGSGDAITPPESEGGEE